MSKVIFFLLLLSLTICQICDLDRCDECDFSIDPVICKTCHGWYESSWDTGLCVLSARLIIATIAGGIIFICVIICTIVKISDYREKITRRPTNIESLESPSQANEEELNQLVWRKSGQRIDDARNCTICGQNGGTMQLRCGHVFHGDCICWQLRKSNKCPTCSDINTESSRIYCIKCLWSYLECKPELYVDIKMKKSRVCDFCTKRE